VSRASKIRDVFRFGRSIVLDLETYCWVLHIGNRITYHTDFKSVFHTLFEHYLEQGASKQTMTGVQEVIDVVKSAEARLGDTLNIFEDELRKKGYDLDGRQTEASS